MLPLKEYLDFHINRVNWSADRKDRFNKQVGKLYYGNLFYLIAYFKDTLRSLSNIIAISFEKNIVEWRLNTDSVLYASYTDRHK